MSVIINKASGLAENIPDDQASGLLQSGDYELPLNDPQGKPVIAPYHEANDLISQGYSQPDERQLQNLMDYAHYSSPGEQFKTFLEGAASAGTLGLSTALETGLGAKPKDISGRKEVNSGKHLLGEFTGLPLSGLLPGGGAIGALTKAGTAAVKASGVGSRIGQHAIRQAAEVALLSGGNEVSKMFAHDPSSSAQHAAVNIGLNGIIGAGFGAAFGVAAPLWKAAHGEKLEAKLKEFKGFLTGDRKLSPVEQDVKKLGIEFPEIVRAATTDNKKSQELFKFLNESFTFFGRKAQQSKEKFRNALNQSALDALGLNPEQIESILLSSDHDAAQAVIKTLEKEIQDKIGPISKAFEAIKEEFKATPLEDSDFESLFNDISRFYLENGSHILEGSTESKFVNKALNSIKNLETLEDLRNFRSQLRTEAQTKNLYHMGPKINQIIQDAEDNLTHRLVSSKEIIKPKKGKDLHPDQIKFNFETAAAHEKARADYKQAMGLLEDLDQRIHVGRYYGTQTFLKALEDKIPEQVLKKLMASEDAGFLKLMAKNFPKTADLLRKSYFTDLIQKVGQKGTPQEPLKLYSLFSVLGKGWSPELKKFALPAGAEEKISAIKKIMEQLPGIMNPPHSAGTKDYMEAAMPTALGLIAGIATGHGAVKGLIEGTALRFFGREAPDAAKYAFLKFLGSENPPSAAGFKASFDYIDAMLKGDRMINQSVSKIFQAGKDVLPAHYSDSRNYDEKLKKKLDELRVDPSDLLNVGGDTGYYLPDHGTALAEVSSRAVEYLNSIKPNTDKSGPFDSDKKPSDTEQAAYDRAIQIANRPLTIMDYLKAGTITSKDVQTFKIIYPGLYQQISQKLISEMISMTAKKDKIPYRTKLSVSRFLGQPLDSTMTAESIMATQPKNGGAAMMPNPMPAPKGGDMKSLGKMPNMFKTPGSARESRRLNK